jgi:hypothetical protein
MSFQMDMYTSMWVFMQRTFCSVPTLTITGTCQHISAKAASANFMEVRPIFLEFLRGDRQTDS